jgi:hypothetical protein
VRLGALITLKDTKSRFAPESRASPPFWNFEAEYTLARVKKGEWKIKKEENEVSRLVELGEGEDMLHKPDQ